MGEIAERVYELKKAAIACGLEPDQAVDDVAEACRVAGEVAPYSEEDSTEKLVKWWHAFHGDYSLRCVGRWQARCGYSRNYDAMEKLWLEYFEPMWLAGCNYVKESSIQNVRGGYNKIASKYAVRLNSEDLEKLKQYCNGVADEIEKVISSQIAKVTIIQRETLFKVIRQATERYGRQNMTKYTGMEVNWENVCRLSSETTSSLINKVENQVEILLMANVIAATTRITINNNMAEANWTEMEKNAFWSDVEREWTKHETIIRETMANRQTKK